MSAEQSAPHSYPAAMFAKVASSPSAAVVGSADTLSVLGEYFRACGCPEALTAHR
jgi:hypothetical protein